MGVLKKIFGSSNKNDLRPVNNDSIFDIITGSIASDDFNVNSRGVINISNDVYSVVTKISNSIANLPISSNNQYLQDLINKNPNPYANGRTLEISVLLNLLVYGDSYCHLQTDKKTGLINRIDLLPNPDVEIYINNDGVSYLYTPTEQMFDDSEILHFSLSSMNGINGLSPLLPLKKNLRLAIASNKTLHNYYKSGLFNKSILTVNDNLSPKDKLALKQKFKQNMGSDNFGGSIIQDDNYIKSVKPYSTQSGNNGFIKDTKTINDQIKRAVCSAYGVPSSLLVVNPHVNTSDEMSRFHSDIRCYENCIINELDRKLSGSWSIGNYINVNTPSDIAQLSKAGSIDKQQAQTLLGLPTTPDKPSDNKQNQN